MKIEPIKMPDETFEHAVRCLKCSRTILENLHLAEEDDLPPELENLFMVRSFSTEKLERHFLECDLIFDEEGQKDFWHSFVNIIAETRGEVNTCTFFNLAHIIEHYTTMRGKPN